MKKLSEMFNARVYINMNVRSFKQIAFRLNKLSSEYLISGSYKSMSRLYETCCGRYGKEGDRNKYYIIDIDFKCDDNFIKDMVSYVNNNLNPEDNTDKIKLINETVNGYHLLSSPFDVKSFIDKYSNMNKESSKRIIDVLKNSNTLLYYKFNN